MIPDIRSAAKRMPAVASAYRFVRDRLFATSARRRLFNRFYATNFWRNQASRSGHGSTLEQTEIVRRELPKLCRELGVKSLLDLPCGDFHWLSHVDLGDIDYTGIDIVPPLIAANRHRSAGPRRRFLALDVVHKVPPRADLVLCRDLLVHLSFADLARAVGNLRRSGSTWLLTTTFPAHMRNEDIRSGQWRMLNLQRPPQGFPPPALVINEGCTEDGGRYRDKSLGLWRLADLP
jgi:hypothetical protein